MTKGGILHRRGSAGEGIYRLLGGGVRYCAVVGQGKFRAQAPMGDWLKWAGMNGRRME